MVNHVVNFSGGRSSAYLVWLFEQRKKNESINVEYVYCDTGAEHPKTYKFINDVVDHWDIDLTALRTVIHMEKGVGPTYKKVQLSECGPDLIPFLDVCKKHGTPTVAAPLCSDRMKSIPADKYCDDRYGRGNYTRWLGMRIDEQRRIKSTEDQLDFFRKEKPISSRVKNTKYLAYISDFTKEDIKEWFSQQEFDLEIPAHLGNCVFCIKKGANKIALAAKDEPEMAVKFISMINSPEVHKRESRGLPPDIMYRSNQSLTSIIEAYKDVDRDELAARIESGRSYDTGACSESCDGAVADPDLFDV